MRAAGHGQQARRRDQEQDEKPHATPTGGAEPGCGVGSVPVSDFNQRIIDEFRANGGKVGPPFEGAPMVVLHTTGAKSGAEREHPLVSFERDGRLFIIASKAGADSHPAWFHNLRANPEVTIEQGTETFSARATPVPEPERAELYAAFAAERPNFAEYQEKTSRVIPVVELART
jgi:deazaflavin-dependent oxidoreductase (nitroreductase family)